MKRDFQQSTNATASGVLLSPVLLSQVFGRSLERSIHSEQERCSREAKSGAQQHYEVGGYKERKLSDPSFRPSLDGALALKNSAEQFPADSSAHPLQVRIFRLVKRAIAQCRDALREFCATRVSEGRLEQALSDIIRELPSANSAFQAFATGKSKALKPEIHEQVCLIGQEALVNAFRHSQATLIEVEVEYRHRNLRLVIRDNGRGIDPEAVRASRNPHWGLLQMEERARVLGAQLCIWSGRGLGTEVEVLLPVCSESDNAA